MWRPSTPFCLIAATLASALAASSANAACSDRPGTPTNVQAKVTSQTPPRIEVSWTNTAGNDELVYWDVEKTADGKIEPQRAGIGRGDRGRNLRVSNTYTVAAGVRYCFKVKARVSPSGCISKIWSNEACETVTPPPKEPTKVPEITAYWLEGNVFRVEGKYFRPNASVMLKVSGAAAAKASVTAKSDAQGLIDVKYSDLCARSGPLTFSTTPGIKRFISRASAKCQLPGYTPNRKIR